MYYIAAPIFNEDQKNVVKDIEDILDGLRIKYFSPREFGVIADEAMTPDRMERIYDMNIRMLQSCDKMIAVLDDRDIGTIFEMGYFTGRGEEYYDEDRTIISFSTQGYGINVMLKHSVYMHCQGYLELDMAIRGIGENELEVSE